MASARKKSLPAGGPGLSVPSAQGQWALATCVFQKAFAVPGPGSVLGLGLDFSDDTELKEGEAKQGRPCKDR